jgi:ankyrin repeat protein
MVESVAKTEKRRASCVEATKHLVLHCRANINATNKNDNTPLHTLCMFDENIAGILDLLEFFASNGADLNLKNNVRLIFDYNQTEQMYPAMPRECRR